jgi:1,4-alpha-glucan branching enzyme
MKQKRKNDLPALKNSKLELLPIHFEFNDPNAVEVCVAGTFNDWKPKAEPMFSVAGGHWMQDTNLAPGQYEYCLVVDGKFIPDPLVPETVPNPFGGRNSILRVLSSPNEQHLHDAECSPMKSTAKC